MYSSLWWRKGNTIGYFKQQIHVREKYWLYVKQLLTQHLSAGLKIRNFDPKTIMVTCCSTSHKSNGVVYWLKISPQYSKLYFIIPHLNCLFLWATWWILSALNKTVSHIQPDNYNYVCNLSTWVRFLILLSRLTFYELSHTIFKKRGETSASKFLLNFHC